MLLQENVSLFTPIIEAHIVPFTINLAPCTGFEPVARRFRIRCSTAELTGELFINELLHTYIIPHFSESFQKFLIYFSTTYAVKYHFHIYIIPHFSSPFQIFLIYFQRLMWLICSHHYTVATLQCQAKNQKSSKLFSSIQRLVQMIADANTAADARQPLIKY